LAGLSFDFAGSAPQLVFHLGSRIVADIRLQLVDYVREVEQRLNACFRWGSDERITV